MSDNSTISNNDTPTWFTVFYHLMQDCIDTKFGIYTITTFTFVITLLLVPLCFFVLYLGYQRSQHQSSGSIMSHSDYFTYHMVVIELMCIFGTTLTCIGSHTDIPFMVRLGIYFLSINYPWQMLFHMLTCLERYLAVVYPITYLSLRTAKGTKIRCTIVIFVWLFGFAWSLVFLMGDTVSVSVIFFSVIVLFLIVISFCSLSILCSLIRPGPGEGGERQVDPSKMKAFYMIMAIMGTLLFRSIGSMTAISVFSYINIKKEVVCGLWMSGIWLYLPSSLILPVLFLQRAGKLLSCKKTKDPRQPSG